MATAIESAVEKALSAKYTSSCEIRKINLDLNPVGEPNKIAYLLENVFSPEECQALIEVTEAEGYSPALVHFGNQAVRAVGYRDSYRVMVDNKKFVKILFNRIGHLLPQTFQNRPHSNKYELLEINERLRFLRYDPGDKFEAHCDGQYERPDLSARTWITLQIYLNEGFEGGETTFLTYEKAAKRKDSNMVPVVPKTGTILVFQHDILHEGSLVKSGRKYTIRTDVLYKREESSFW